mmetsp:Transcript_50272/g.114268  ORF Transcript_50272/g.114268 Transcript_50272/m.114268 type:complete len:251 (-) Transcript_50272:420-1172(-)
MGLRLLRVRGASAAPVASPAAATASPAVAPSCLTPSATFRLSSPSPFNPCSAPSVLVPGTSPIASIRTGRPRISRPVLCNALDTAPACVNSTTAKPFDLPERESFAILTAAVSPQPAKSSPKLASVAWKPRFFTSTDRLSASRLPGRSAAPPPSLLPLPFPLPLLSFPLPFPASCRSSLTISTRSSKAWPCNRRARLAACTVSKVTKAAPLDCPAGVFKRRISVTFPGEHFSSRKLWMRGLSTVYGKLPT